MVCAAASAFLLYRADHAYVYAAGFVSRSAHFVFTGQRAPFRAETGFFAPYMVARSANGNGRLGRLEIASSLFSFLSLPDCVHPRSPGEKGQQGVTGESRRHIFLYSWSGDSGITLKQTTTWEGMVVYKKNKVHTSVSRNKKILSRKELEKMKTNKKLFVLLLAVVMVFSLSISAFAYNTGDGAYLWKGYGSNSTKITAADIAGTNSSMYIVGNSGDTTATVTLVIEAPNAYTSSVVYNTSFRKEITTTVTNSTGVTVSELLAAVQGTNGLTFDFTGNEYHPTFLNSVTYNGYTWSAGGVLGLDGWSMRVNDKLPVKATADGLGYEGTLITQTYLHDGDVVHFFYDFSADIDLYEAANADYVRGVYVSRTSNSVTVELQSHQTNMAIATIDNRTTYIMHVYDYTKASGITAKLYDADGNQVGSARYSASNGRVTFTTSGTLAAGRYTLVSNSSLYVFDEESEYTDYDTAFMGRTGAYSYIDIPAA